MYHLVCMQLSIPLAFWVRPPLIDFVMTLKRKALIGVIISFGTIALKQLKF